MKNQITIFELKRLIKDKVNYILLILLFIFTLFSIFTGSKWTSFQIDTINKIEKDQRIKLDKQIIDAEVYQGNNDILELNYPLSFPCYLNYSMCFFVTKPHQNSIFSIGQSDFYPNYIRYKRLGAYTLHNNYEIQNPLNLLIGKLDFYFLLVYVIPLFIIVIAFDVISTEKELGTLKMIKVYYPNINLFFLYKFIFRYVLFILFFLISILIGIQLFSPFPFSSYLTNETFISLICIMLYVLFWFSVVYLINSLFRSSTFNGVSLTILWLIIVYVIPTAVDNYVVGQHPVPIRINGIVNSLDVISGNNSNSNMIYNKLINKKTNYLRLKKDTIIDKLRLTSFYPKMVINSIYFDSIFNIKQEKINICLDKQYNLLKIFRMLSPTLTIQNSLNLVSRNGYSNFRNFQIDFNQKYKEVQKKSIDRLFLGKRMLTSEFRQEGNLLKYKRRESVIKDSLINTLLILIFCFCTSFAGYQIFKKKSSNYE